jgi:O-antigen/teichoic acid export membrane protein
LFDKLKSLASQTAIYGLSSIIGRLINFVLVPIHTAALSKAEFGINTVFYSSIGFLIVIFTYGMETAFFRYVEKYSDRQNQVYSTIMTSILGTTTLALVITFLFHSTLVQWLKYEDYPEFLTYLILIVALDAISAIPMARLRQQKRAIRFVSIRLILIGLTVIFNLFFFYYCDYAIANNYLGDEWISTWFESDFKVQYIFISNLIASAVMLLFLLPEFRSVRLHFDPELWKKLIAFGIPLMIGGLAGVANELLDRQLLNYLLPPETALDQAGVYGAVYKLSIFLVLFNQAFRYAAEPFFFSTQKDDNAKETYAIVMRYFVVVMVIGFVFVWSFIDIFKYFIDEKFWEGLFVLPILLLANVMLGINLNLSIWYKLIDKTYFGILVTGVGFVFTVGLNLYLIPKMGYEGAAWATLISYTAMALTSYFLGQKFYPVPYPIGRIGLYLTIAIVAVLICTYFKASNFIPQTLVFVLFVSLLGLLEKKQLLRLKTRMTNK